MNPRILRVPAFFEITQYPVFTVAFDTGGGAKFSQIRNGKHI